MKTEFYFLGKNQKVFGPISGEELARMKSGGELAHYTWILKVGESAWKVLDSAPPILPQFAPVSEKKAQPHSEQVAEQEVEHAAAVAAAVAATESAPPLPNFQPIPVPSISEVTPPPAMPKMMPKMNGSNPEISQPTRNPKPAPTPVQAPLRESVSEREAEEHTVEVNLRAHLQNKANKNSSYQDTRIQGANNDAFRAILYDSRNAVTAWVSQAAHHGCEIRADLAGADPLFVDKSGATLNLHEIATGKTAKVSVHVDQVFRRDQHWIYKVRWATVPAIFEESQAS